MGGASLSATTTHSSPTLSHWFLSSDVGQADLGRGGKKRMSGEMDASGGDPGTQKATEQEHLSLEVSCPGDAATYCSWPSQTRLP